MTSGRMAAALSPLFIIVIYVIVGCHITLLLVWKKEEREGCDIAYLDAVHHSPLSSNHCWFIVGCHITDGYMAPVWLCEERRVGEESHCSPGVDSDDDMCHHHVDVMAHPLTCQVVFTILSKWLALTWCCPIVIVIGVWGVIGAFEQWLQEVVVGGGSGDEAKWWWWMVVWWWLRRKWFVCWWCTCDDFGKHCSLYIRIWRCLMCEFWDSTLWGVRQVTINLWWGSGFGRGFNVATSTLTHHPLTHVPLLLEASPDNASSPRGHSSPAGNCAYFHDHQTQV